MRRFAWLLALALWAPDPPLSSAQTGQQEPVSAAEVKRAVDDAVEIRRVTQQQQNQWAQERAELVARYRSLKASVAYLEDRREVEVERAAELQADVDEYARRLEESERFEGGLQDTLLAIFANLETHLQTDLPFHMGTNGNGVPRERTARLAAVRTELVRTDVEPAEKLRRILEALLIEAQYGGGFEVYPEDIGVGGETLAVDVLRLGRLALLWRTPDGSRAGEFDRASGTWVELDGSARGAVNAAVDMAMRRRQHEVIALPLGRIAP